MATVPRARAGSGSLTKGERTRARLLAAAEHVFGAKGFHAASIVDITRRARVAMGTFYVYFPSKHAILVELVRTRGHEMRAALAAATKDARDRGEAERAGIEAFLGWIGKHPAIYRVVRTAEFADPKVYREWYVRLAEEYARALRSAMSRREIDQADPEALAYALMGAVDYAGLRWVLWNAGSPPKEAVETVVAFVQKGLGVGRAPARRRAKGAEG